MNRYTSVLALEVGVREFVSARESDTLCVKPPAYRPSWQDKIFD
ncbi:hypothetical protein [Brasilonema sp. UFV-L1]|nr:hypothetical protein [Brasilonema sp. UFV-L1]